MEHWVTFTRHPIPTSRIMAAHAHQPDPKTPSTLEELFAQLGENVTASIEVDPLSTGDQMPEIPLAEQIVTALNHQLGYDEAASIAKQALKEGRTIREVVIDRGHVADGKLTEQQLDEALDVLAMAYPHGRG